MNEQKKKNSKKEFINLFNLKLEYMGNKKWFIN